VLIKLQLTIKHIEHRAYQLWIEENISSDDAIGNCSMWVIVMKQAFPELKIVKGSISNQFTNNGYHEYLIAPNGSIVDPTRAQFDNLFGNNWKYNLKES